MRQITVAIFLCVFLLLPSLSFSGSVDYLYDDNGRLVRVSNSDNTRILYQYDEVGNLISILKETSTPQALPPVLQSIEPDIFLIGNNYNIIITGQNLLTTSSVTSDNPNITIKFIASIDTKITAIISIAGTASAGQANITITTLYGSASMTINLYGATIIPEAVTLFPASTTTMSVSLTPSAPEDVEVKINNNNPDIIETPPSATILAGGSADFTVNALKGGTGTINIGVAEAIVYVIGGNDSERGAVIESAPVSVSIDTVPSNTVINSSPVSVEWLAVANAITVSAQVSVKICPLPARVVGASTTYYSTLQDAYNAALDGDIIQSQAVELTENLSVNLSKTVTLDGGYDCDFTTVVGKTSLKGAITITNGKVEIKNFILKK